MGKSHKDLLVEAEKLQKEGKYPELKNYEDLSYNDLSSAVSKARKKSEQNKKKGAKPKAKTAGKKNAAEPKAKKEADAVDPNAEEAPKAEGGKPKSAKPSNEKNASKGKSKAREKVEAECTKLEIPFRDEDTTATLKRAIELKKGLIKKNKGKEDNNVAPEEAAQTAAPAKPAKKSAQERALDIEEALRADYKATMNHINHVMNRTVGAGNYKVVKKGKDGPNTLIYIEWEGQRIPAVGEFKVFIVG